MLVLALATTLTAAAAPPPQEGGKVTVLIKAPAGEVAELKARHGAGFDFGRDGFITDVSPAALAGLQRRPGVFVEVQPERHVLGRFERISGKSSGKPGSGGGTTRPATPADQTPWGIEVSYNDASVPNTSGGGGVRVAVLDTGVASHVDLPKPVVCVDASKGLVARFGTCKDGHGHGTHVTGTILANGGSDSKGIYGVAPSATYSSYKVCSDSGMCSAGAIAWSIRHAADNGAKIISMSLGGGGLSTAEVDAIEYASGKGVLIVAAAGNSGDADGSIEYPGAYPKVVSVASLTLVSTANGPQDGAGPRTTADIASTNLGVNSWSSRGKYDSNCATSLQVTSPEVSADKCLEVAAPGHKVESTYKDGTYAIWSGTSMATPHVSGLAAKHWQGNASATRTWLQTRAQGFDVTQAFFATAEGSEVHPVSEGYEQHGGLGNVRVS